MSDIGSGRSLSLQALPGQFLHSATSEDPDLDTGFRDLRPRTAVNPALLSSWQEPSPALSSETASSYFLFLAYLGFTFCTLTAVKLRYQINFLRLSGAPRVWKGFCA